MKEFVESKVKHNMTRNVITVSPELPINELEKLFSKHGFNMFPVIENKKLLGIVSEYDFLKAFLMFGSNLQSHESYKKIAKKKCVKDVYSQPMTVREWHPLTYVLELMAQTMYKSFPVINDEGKLVGVIARRDLIKKLKAC